MWIAAVAAALLLSGCTSGGGAPSRLAAAHSNRATLAEEITAKWLAGQPGNHFGGFSFHLLDKDNRALSNWAGLVLAEEAASADKASFVLSITENAPADTYLYITYPNNSWRLDSAELARGRGAQYLLLTSAHRSSGMLAIACARLGDARTRQATPGKLLSISFTAGSERVYKASARVNESPDSAPQLSVDTGGDGYTLSWWEINTGDYDNNSVVGAPDITPIAMHFLKRVDEAANPAELEVVDGDSNGEINSADLVPIAANFGRRIEGYTVYYASGASPAPAEFKPVQQPSVLRSTVWEAASTQERRERLHYSYPALGTAQVHNYYVRAWADDEDGTSEGVASNTVSYTGVPANLPPVWDTTVEFTSVEIVPGGLALGFGSAADPEGGTVSYVLRWVAGLADALDGPAAQERTLTSAQLGIEPPFEHTLELAAGGVYSVAVQAEDPQGARSTITAPRTERLPMPGTSSEAWPYFRNDAGRSGTNPLETLGEPLAPAWQSALGGAGSFNSQLAISSAGNVYVRADSGQLYQAELDTGDATPLDDTAPGDASYALALDGTTLAGTDSGGLRLSRLLVTGPALLGTVPAPQATAPLLLGGYVITATGISASAHTLDYSGQLVRVWEQPLGGGTSGALASAAGGDYVYAALRSGTVQKLALADGAPAGTYTAAGELAGDSMVLDAAAGLLYVALADGTLLEIDTDSMELARGWPAGVDMAAATAPVLLNYATLPLAVYALQQSAPEAATLLAAVDLASGNPAWQAALPMQATQLTLCASAARVFASTDNGLYVYDFSGRLRQQLLTPASELNSSPALADGKLVQLAGGSLHAYNKAAPDEPPQWVGTEGIRALAAGDGELTIEWDHAVDDHGEPVNYVVLIGEGAPPAFEPPYPGTQLVTDIPHTGNSHSHVASGLDNDTRYYVAVRAYDGYWDDAPNLDGNTRYLAATPPWQREELLLGDGLDLPAGEMYFMRGLTAPDGTLHLAYTSRSTGGLRHVWGETGSWQHEGATLYSFTSPCLDLGWDSGLAIAGSFAGQAGLLRRTGADTWSQTLLSPTTTALNPQASIVLGSNSIYAYTQYAGGAFPAIDIDYFQTRDTGLGWDGLEPFEELNYAGRDLDAALNPSDTALPWFAYQRGGGNAPNRATPVSGECYYARATVDGYEYELVDAGDNAPDSDAGKRVQQAVDSAGNVHLAYFDLDSSPGSPRGQLKYAFNDGSGWQVETLRTFELDFQTGSNQFTYGELGLQLTDAGEPVVAWLARLNWASDIDTPHSVHVYVEARGGGQWHSIRLSDSEYVFPRDREPCVLLMGGDGSWHVFYASGTQQDIPVADKLVHLYRPAP